MSLKLNSGSLLCYIYENDTYTGDYIGIEQGEGTKNINIEGNKYFTLAPHSDKRTKVYIAGPTGCGKTYFAMQFLKNYKILFPDKEILILTEDTEDITIKEAEFTNKVLDLTNEDIRYDAELLDPSIYKEMCVFFDDVDYLDNDRFIKKLDKLKKNLLGVGRHKDTSVLISSHIPMNYQKTRFILSEADYIVLFPSCGSSHFTDTFFKHYFSRINSQILTHILESKSRWICCRMVAPQAVILEKEIILLK